LKTAAQQSICRGGEYHRLHVQFRPPDDGPVRPETCRGKKIAVTVKAIPLQAWTGPDGSRRMRLPDFKTIST